MRILYLPSTTQDIEWIALYYDKIFPQGRVNLLKQLFTSENILSENPLIGKNLEGFDGVRELIIPKMPFSIIYRVQSQHIEILRLWDLRRERDKMRF